MNQGHEGRPPVRGSKNWKETPLRNLGITCDAAEEKTLPRSLGELTDYETCHICCAHPACHGGTN